MDCCAKSYEKDSEEKTKAQSQSQHQLIAEGRSVKTIFAVGALWFASSSLFSTYANTSFLRHFKDPLLHTAVRFGGSCIFSGGYFHTLGGIPFSRLPSLLQQVAVPATLLWIANFANSVSLDISGITLTYVVKASIPVFTVIVCLLRGERFAPMIYISLLPICIGVALASGTDIDFSLKGFAAAVISAFAQTLMNLLIKSVREKEGLSAPLAFYGMATVSCILTAPVMFFSYSPPAVRTDTFSRLTSDSGPYFFVIAAMAYHLEYILNFTFVGFVDPVTFAVSDNGKRLAIIVVGSFIFSKSLTFANIVGLSISLAGVLWYSYIDHVEKKNKQKTR